MRKNMGAVAGTAVWVGVARRSLFGIAALLATSAAALADPTILTCNHTGASAGGPIIYVLNEAQGTVTVTMPQFEYTDGSGTVPERKYVVPAKFSSYSIIFSFTDIMPPGGQRTDYNETIDRTTGILTYSGAMVGHLRYPISGTMTCHVGSPATKF